MFRDQKHLKDSSSNLGISIKDTANPISYTKTDKLITALYMVTDIIDKEEPLRNKLRTLGTDIISDISLMAQDDHMAPSRAVGKISEVMSFLDIASAINIISQMNCNILRKEFVELDQSIKASGNKAEIIDRKINLAEFFSDESGDSHPSLLRPGNLSNGHHPRSLGVQKGSTLMKALKGIGTGKLVSDRIHSVSDRNHNHSDAPNFDVLKKHRREDIVNVIKIIGGNATIKDIKAKAKSLPGGAGSLASCGEKTLQRELVSMVHDGVLKKTGEKRWSRYFIV